MKFYRRRDSRWWIYLWFVLLVVGIYFLVWLLDSGPEIVQGAEIMVRLWKLYQIERSDSAFFFGVWDLVGSQYYFTEPPPADSLSVIWRDTKRAIQNNPGKNDSLIFAGLSRFCRGFSDGHTHFFTPAEVIFWSQYDQHKIVGLGFKLVAIEDSVGKIKAIRVFNILPNTPAEKAGITRGDFILKINQQSIRKFKTLTEVVNTCRGEAGTDIKLTIWRKEWNKSQEIILQREEIVIPQVSWRIIEEGVVYLEITDFLRGANKELDRAISEVLKYKPRAIIVDLRNNPGGYLGEVNSILSHWIFGVSCRLKDRQGKEKMRTGSLFKKAKLRKIQTVILTNQGTASASEIMIGALRDYGLVTTVGQTTYGKGSFQFSFALPFKTGVKITNGLWLTPKGTYIHKQGFVPDIKIEFDQDLWLDVGIDNQMERAIEFIKDGK